MGALLLAVIAAMTPFVADRNLAYAQVVPRQNSDLSNLALSVGDLTPTLDLGTPATEYTANVPNRTGRITVTATPNIQGAQVSIRYGGDYTGGTGSLIGTGGNAASGGSVPLSVGETEIGIEVKALDYAATDDTGTTVDETSLVSVYVVTVTRLAAGLSDKADLTSLTVAGSNAGGETTNVTTSPTLSPGFKKGVTSYTTLVSNLTDTMTVTPVAETGATFVIMPGH